MESTPVSSSKFKFKFFFFFVKPKLRLEKFTLHALIDVSGRQHKHP